MLAVSPLRSIKDEKNQGEMEGNFSMPTTTTTGDVDFGDLSEGNLLESINFDDLFVGIDVNGDVLPDLEMFGEFSVNVSTGEESSEINSSTENSKVENDQNVMINTGSKNEEEEDKASCNSSGQDFGSNRGEEIVSMRDESVVVNQAPKDGGKGRKSSSAQSKKNNNSNNAQGKRKIKVDWTPELHRRFVQAVEQLGVDKAVPSRILEIMGTDCLTRHNIASHLQKYRSHRKHLLAREAEAASWSQRRQLYAGGGKIERNPWLAPNMGFPPMTTPMHHFRPLHVWGHPSMSFVHMWPKHLSNSSPLSWPLPPPAAPPQDPSFWHQQAPNALIPGTTCFPQPLTPTKFGSPPVPGIPPHAMYKADHGIGVPGPRPLFDFHPSKECIDAAIGDVLSKPWLPLPIGLKAPALDSVMSELQRQGIPNIPPSSA